MILFFIDSPQISIWTYCHSLNKKHWNDVSTQEVADLCHLPSYTCIMLLCMACFCPTFFDVVCYCPTPLWGSGSRQDPDGILKTCPIKPVDISWL